MITEKELKALMNDHDALQDEVRDLSVEISYLQREIERRDERIAQLESVMRLADEDAHMRDFG